MSDTTNSCASSYDDNLSTGQKVVTYAMRLLAFGAALSVAFSCSSIIMGIIMFIIMGLFMALLYGAAELCILFKGNPAHFASLGSVVNNTTARVTSLFTRKAAV